MDGKAPRRLPRFSAILLLMAWLGLLGPAPAAAPEDTGAQLSPPPAAVRVAAKVPVRPLTLPGKPNPHGRADQCVNCHVSGQTPQQSNYLPQSCVECHDAQAHLREIHPTDFAGDNAKAPTFAGAPLQNGKSTCLTCHAIGCGGDGNIRIHRENRAMLRGGPWPRETDFCFRCHDRGLYKATNPHQDSVDPDICLNCHTQTQPVRSAGSAADPGAFATLHHPPNELCIKCHKDLQHEREHLGRSVFNNRLKMNTAATMDRFTRTTGIVLPLDNGTITCSTCHSPNPACDGADWETPATRLLRAPKERICYACHDL